MLTSTNTFPINIDIKFAIYAENEIFFTEWDNI